MKSYPKMEGQMTIRQVITRLHELMKQHGRYLLLKVCPGVYPGWIHSYRGHYEDLAIEPRTSTVLASEYAEQLERCIGRTFQGYKGGGYVCEESTVLWVASRGELGAAVTGVEWDEASDCLLLRLKEEEMEFSADERR